MKIQGTLLAVVLALCSVSAWSQAIYPENEYKKLIRVDEEINPLGENPFGESVSLYDGSFTFTQTDIHVPGIGPSIDITRTFRADGDIPLRQGNGAFGDWDIEIPRLTTLTSDSGNHTGWVVNSLVYTDRCTNMREPPWILMGRPGNPPIEAEEWWNEGYRLHMPGSSGQDVVILADVNPVRPQKPGYQFVATTKDHWMVACASATANGQPGESFVVFSPDGTLYRLNYLVYRDARDFVIFRKKGYMLATSVEDRFGNWVHYNYTAGKISSIEASDGRLVTFGYNADGTQIAQINVVAGNQTRTWWYEYQKTITGYTLTGVTLPDSVSKWSYQFENLGYEVKSYMQDMPRDCPDPTLPENVTVTGRATSPSGLFATFEARPMRHGRSAVPEMCEVPPQETDQRGYLRIPRYYNNLALTRKQFTGAGLSTQEWIYTYPTAVASWASECGSGCPSTKQVDVKDPSGNYTRYTFSNRFDASEGKLLRTDYYSGAVASNPVRSDVLAYADPAGGPWPARYGYNPVLYLNSDKITQEMPVRSRTTIQDGDSYVWEATGFNEFAQVTQTRRYNSIPGQAVIEERTTYLNDRPHWVLGLPLQTDNLTRNETVTRNEYDPSSLTLAKRWHFNKLAMSYAFNGQGLLASFTDGNNNTTALSNYKRGIPQTINYPDNTSESLVVDDFGQIRSITDQARNTTGYDYDALGRLAYITYPSGDEVSWYPKAISFQLIGADRGVNGTHWRRTVTKGNARSVTDFDALLRPVISDTYDISNGNSHTSTRTDYDWKGQKTFASYPVAGSPDLAGMSAGTSSAYDSLGRLKTTSQTSELGLLTATTVYLSGARKQVTDPKGFTTTISYQVFDQPAYDAVTLLQAPEGVNQSVTRDVYGNPEEIHQWGTANGYSNDVVKRFYYDSYYRLCRTSEPESYSEVTAYDAADNVAWTASGLRISGDGCGQEVVADGAKIQRTYDAMNRVKTLLPPSGTQSTVYTYDPLGNVKQADSGLSSWVGIRNKLGQLTSETLNVTGNGSNVLRYEHDGHGSVRTITYPDTTVVDYAPDALGRPTRAGSFASNVSYDPDGDIKYFVYGNGAEYITDKNERHLLRNFTYTKGGAFNLSEDLAYDKNGNITKLTDIAGGLRTKEMSYDALNRLTQAKADGLWGTESYAYDPVNNIRQRMTAGQAFDYNYDGTNRLMTITQAGNAVMTLGYDDRGNVTNKNGNALLFDAKNQLTSIPGYGSHYYDASGRRVQKARPDGSSTYYFYNQAGQLLYQFDTANAKTTAYIYLGRKLIARNEGSASAIRGNIDGVSVDGNGLNAKINGWACSSSITQSIAVHLYVGGPAGTGTFIGSYNANLASEAGVATACGVGSGSFRFGISVADATRAQYAGKSIYIHGISPVGNDNALIAGSGNFSVPAMPTAPAMPTTISATKAADLTRIDVSWSATTGATSYKIERQFNTDAWAQIYSGTATSFTVSGPADGNYGFRVQACNAIGCSAAQTSAVVSIAHIPPTPGSISVPASSTGSLSVSWTASAFASSYVLEQSVNGGGWSVIYNAGSTSTSFSVGASGTYVYRVKACNANGCSGYATSGTVAVTIPPSSAPSLSAPGSSNTGTYTVSWSGVAGATSYTLQEQVSGGGWTTVQASGATNWGAGGKGNGTYGYRVQACNTAGCGAWSGTVNVAVSLVPAAPNFSGPYLSTKGRIDSWTVYWDAVPGATRYEIVRADNGVTVYSGTALSYVLESGTSPYPWLENSYRLRACNGNGCSPWVDVY
ncbi:chitinase N-terminal domain-containing protein [Dyella jiangningensis]|uniref:Fibronectin type-III domain-containing protein n=1 Tax=Dyella jiangningensis TaxID=1379159 RepID=A0A328P3P6_9GAMM|nr:chitinase N-terminal domain-containing protein [Dyella jiangningensis]RAO75911.1 hypothetical protein CA260_17960 [Dyella jiangningensis]